MVTVFSPACDLVPLQRQLQRSGLSSRLFPSCALLWKYAEQCLPHVMVDLPHRLLAECDSVRKAFAAFSATIRHAGNMSPRCDGDCGRILPPCRLRQCTTSIFRTICFPLTSEEVFVDCGAFDGERSDRFLTGAQTSGGSLRWSPIRSISSDSSNASRKFLGQCASGFLFARWPLRPRRERFASSRMVLLGRRFWNTGERRSPATRWKTFLRA